MILVLTNSTIPCEVDNEDFDRVNQYKWRVHYQNGIPRSIMTTTNPTKKLTRYILEFSGPITWGVVDHIDRNIFNNKRSNLRLVSNSENAMNRPKQGNNTSGYKGVSWNRIKNKWEAYISVNRKRKFLGYFECKIEAAKAYNKAALEKHGEFAFQNPI